ncbi:hypothetical protein GDO78_013074 [Eleutherodactylus coqui]|uniref:GTPase activating protein and VPS9 domains 1 n=1 Tax=Eleutherodactylus coqui TaxID=57060 RepID=A0A8J6K3G9_ELECQ|nr:hypothetical protein GDO78_013074 [Eleutherodactylus coqui]
MVKPDIHTLARHLKQERLYVNSEKQLIQRLNADVLKTAEKLYRTSWISKQQRINLDRLILTSAEASPAECCQHAKVLEDTQFVDGYKQLGFQETAYGEFLNRLRENPRLIASCLVAGEKLNQENAQSVIHTVFTSLYGNCIMQEDESYLLQVLRYLIEFELKESDNPRRLLRKGTCAFSIIFKLFSEGLFSAKLFLTATLHEPIMQLLVEDEDHLEIDPSKVTERFSPAQQEKLFGEKGSERFRQKVQEMVESNETKLVTLVNKFIGYLKQNTYCFPHSLRWIVSQMYKTLSCVEGLDVGEVRSMCTDLLLTCFICPAIVNPEQYGIISDAPINEVARFNLMQACVAAFLDVVIGGRAVETPPLSSVNLLEGLSRTVVYMTYSQLVTLLGFSRSVISGDQLREEDRMALENLLATVPQTKPGRNHDSTPYSTPQLSPATTPACRKNRLPIVTRSRSKTSLLEAEHEGSPQDTVPQDQPEEVLVISLGTGPQLTPGMMSENEVLNMQLVDGGQADVPVDDTKLHGKPDKTLRFSLCSDNLEGISEGPSNRSNSVSSLDLEGESVSELGAGPSGSNGVEALQLLEHEQATTQDNLDDKLRKFEIRDMMGLTEDRDISETVSETWSTDVLGSDFDPNIDEDRLQEIAGAAAENMLGSLLCLPGSGSILLDPCTGSTISETTSEAWSVEVLPSDSEAPDLKQEERLQELESCSGLGSTSDDTEVREVSSRPSTPGLSVVSGISATSEDIPNKIEDLRSECSSDFGGKDSVTSPEVEDCVHNVVDGESLHDSPRDEALQNMAADDLPDSASQTAPPPDSSFSYRDAKKKLRLALCSADSVAFPMLSHSTRNGLPDHTDPEDNEIVCFLKVQLAEAINLQDKNLMAQIQETMRCKLTAADDKTAQVEEFLQSLYGAMAQDVIWQNASEEQLQDAQIAIERSVMNRIFKLAFYPNQDADVLRDQVLYEHIQRLSKVVTANHRALQIPEVYLREAPWPSAQAEIRTISAYKTPRDKVQCILRMCSTIMNLLSLANEYSVPGADDFVPVLVFVLIKANPPCLLSTVQYINNFYANRLTGEESYWWMQFTAAVEFIKTIDDRK